MLWVLEHICFRTVWAAAVFGELHLSRDIITDCIYKPSSLQCKIKFNTLFAFFSFHILNDVDLKKCCEKSKGHIDTHEEHMWHPRFNDFAIQNR